MRTINGYTWHEITRDYATREAALAEAKKYHRRDWRHSVTKLLRKRDGTYTVVQRAR